MPEPLPVDVVTSTWDYIVGTASIVGSLGAGGALLIAALAYRRQVDDTRRQQAAQVLIRVADSQLGPRVEVVNGSDQPIFKIHWRIQAPGPPILAPVQRDFGGFGAG